MLSKILFIFILCTVTLSSCSPNTEAITSTPVATLLQTVPPILTSTSTATNIPTSTNTLPPTNTPVPSKTLTIITPSLIPSVVSATETTKPTSKSIYGMGTPVSSWNGFPVMPGAIEGGPAGFSYVYAVKVSIAEAEDFYTKQMSANGWALANRQASETSIYGGPSVVMDFSLDSKKANIMLIFSTNENYTMIMLTMVKQE